TFGGEATRFQLNGTETFNQRPLILFTSNFGFPAIENLRAGRATTYEVSIGEMARGFRNWSGRLYFGDQWRVNNRLQLYFGLRYGFDSVPTEVNGLNTLSYRCDCNNFAPSLAIAWQLPGAWMLRTSYSTSFDQIPPVTYGQVRYNLPHVVSIQVQNPNVLNPLNGINLNDPDIRSSPILYSPDLVSPYAHQYGLSLERKLGAATLRLGYIGSRSFKLMNVHQANRADPVDGIPLTTATVPLRRADPRYYDVRTVMSAGIAYLDAGQATFEMPRWRSIGGGVSYTFGKAIDEGQDYTATAANRDMSRARSQSQYGFLKDRRGLSNFDSTHSLVLFHYWDLPRLRSRHSWANWVADGWQWTGNVLLKSGTPLTLYVGSDAPGFGNVDGGASDRPNILDPSILGRVIPHPDVAPMILSRDKFGYIQPGQLAGTLGRGTFRRARIANWNGSLGKRWRLPGNAERFVQFRGEAINLSNTPQFDEPNRNLNASAFGKITNTLNDGRVFQFSLRLTI
ncbi:MAG: TonB-dependent receptor, partial [Bryobacteraceae bacterium]|nr:TonB-dependent receptor [Bryobacteraceae bacterium]